MRSALRLATRGLGQVWSNPAVGCVIVKDDVVVGRGATAPGGRPHAEAVALAQAGDRARHGTAYVTLEPCAHHGQTPPCAQALIDAGIGRVVVATMDPDARVDGRGVAMLRSAGIPVAVGLCEAEGAAVNAGFLTLARARRPMVTLKLATTLDGKIATAGGDSKWITGELARQRGHLLRAQHDAILVGSGTVLADDPALTCRIPGLSGRSPVRVVLDRRLRIPMSAQLIQSAGATPVILFTDEGKDTGPIRAAGVEVATLADGDETPAKVLEELGRRGFTRVLIEGGAAVATSFLAASLVDEVAWFRAPVVAGGDGVDAIAGLNLRKIRDLKRFRRVRSEAIGDDLLESYVVRA